MRVPPFEHSVFINCPFDEEYSPILQAIAFCVFDLGFYPRIAPENANGSANRLDRILSIVQSSKFAIHDLSRCKSRSVGEFMRLNMPFELGIDFGGSRFGNETLQGKSILVLEQNRYDYQKALSDIAGWDIEAHGGDHIVAVRCVNSWLTRHAGANPKGAALISLNYATFQEWYWERELIRGASEDDIRSYPTIQVIDAMQEWIEKGRPV